MPIKKWYFDTIFCLKTFFLQYLPFSNQSYGCISSYFFRFCCFQDNLTRIFTCSIVFLRNMNLRTVRFWHCFCQKKLSFFLNFSFSNYNYHSIFLLIWLILNGIWPWEYCDFNLFCQNIGRAFWRPVLLKHVYLL